MKKKELKYDERVEEIAEMIGGKTLTENTLQSAKELMEQNL